MLAAAGHRRAGQIARAAADARDAAGGQFATTLGRALHAPSRAAHRCPPEAEMRLRSHALLNQIRVNERSSTRNFDPTTAAFTSRCRPRTLPRASFVSHIVSVIGAKLS